MFDTHIFTRTNMVLKISGPLTICRYISQVHIDCIIFSYGTCSIFTHM
jgi:hypothetical protein